MPATNSLAGALAITSTSIKTISGFLGTNTYSSNSPSSVYNTETALVGASVLAIVGTITTGAFS